jgi:hypothetical protein
MVFALISILKPGLNYGFLLALIGDKYSGSGPISRLNKVNPIFFMVLRNIIPVYLEREIQSEMKVVQRNGQV